MNIRHPVKSDGVPMFEIATETPLDTNAKYHYIGMAAFFSRTCMVAEIDGELAGFCTGSIVCDPDRMFPDTLFIWQIAALKKHRGKGISKAMLTSLVDELQLPYIQCTIAPHNQGSMALFGSVAEQYGAEFIVKEGLTKDDFLGDEPEERLIQIGPISKENFGDKAA